MASVVQSNPPDRLTQIFNGLKNRNPDIRTQAAEELTHFVSQIPSNQMSSSTSFVQVSMNIAEMSSDAAAKLWDDNINRKLFDLTHTQNSVEAFGGLLAIGA